MKRLCIVISGMLIGFVLLTVIRSNDAEELKQHEYIENDLYLGCERVLPQLFVTESGKIMLYGTVTVDTESVTIGGQKIEIEKEILEIDGDIDRRHIEYPYLDSDNDIAQLINEQIYDLIDRECLQDSEYTVHEKITYEAMDSDGGILSIHFTGYRSVAASYADFDMALNFEMDTGKILTLQSFYTLPEISQLVDVAITEEKMSVANIPLKENEMRNYIDQFFEKVFSDDSYIRRSDNFFVRGGNLYFIAESYPSLRGHTYVEWKDGQQLLNKYSVVYSGS